MGKVTLFTGGNPSGGSKKTPIVSNISNPSAGAKKVKLPPSTTTTTTTTSTTSSSTSTTSTTTSSSTTTQAPSVSAAKIYTQHTMLAFTNFSNDQVAWATSMKNDYLYNNLWLYTDYYDGTYAIWLNDMMNAAQAAGIAGMPGAHGANSGAGDREMVKATWNHPALARRNGKRLYAKYAGNGPNELKATYDALAAEGYSRDDYKIFFNTLYSIEVTYRGDLVNKYYTTHEITDNPYIEYVRDAGGNILYGQAFWFWNGKVFLDQVVSAPWNESGLDFMVDHYHLDGFLNFSADKNTADNIRENTYMTNVQNNRGVMAMAGVTPFYASVGFVDNGFDGTAQIWQAIIDMPPALRPVAVCDNTSDDYAELSYMGPLLTPTVNGVGIIPAPSAGFHLGDNTRFALMDHTGVNRFLRPWIEAYLNDSTTLSFPQDKIFAWYWVHPNHVPVIPNIPAEVAAMGPHFNQAWWSGTVYATGQITVGGGNQIGEMQNYFSEQIGKIRMAAHLTTPSFLRISIAGNTYTSSLKQPGAAYWECPQALGIPTFSIIASNGTTVKKTGTGLVINNSIYPAAYNPYMAEIITN